MTGLVAALERVFRGTIFRYDLVSPIEIGGLHIFSEDQLYELCDTLPSPRDFGRYRRHGCVVVAGPSKPMSLAQVLDFCPEFSFLDASRWCHGADSKEEFPCKDFVNPGWVVISKGLVPGSAGLSLNEAQASFASGVVVSNAAEALWAYSMFAMARNVYLLNNISARIAGRSLDGSGLFMGRYGFRGFYFGKCKDEDKSRSLGTVSVVRYKKMQLVA